VGFKNIATLLQDKRVIYKELKLKDYRNLVKSFLGDEIDPETVFVNTDSILQLTTELTSNEINNLNFVDYILLLLHIRSTSIGNHINLYTETNENKQLKIELFINNLIDIIFECFSSNILQDTIYNDIIVSYRLPTINDILFYEKNDICSVPTFFVQQVYINHENNVNLLKYSYEEREKIIQTLPVKIALLIDQQVNKIYTALNKINFFKSISSKKFNKVLPFNTNTELLAFLLKLVFNTDLENMYNNIFILCKGANLNGMFLDNCSPGEFYLFTKKFEELNQQQNKQENTQQYGSNNDLPPINSEADFGLE
jgi:hypothetical protein